MHYAPRRVVGRTRARRPSGVEAGKVAMIAILGIAVALTCSPVVAVAKKKKHKHVLGPVVTVSATASLPSPISRGDRHVSCPPGTTLVGGGFNASPANENGPVVYQSSAVNGTGWMIRSSRDHSGSGAASVTVEAYCRRNAPGLMEVRAFANVPAGDGTTPGKATASARCPAGLKAVAGGFNVVFDAATGAGTIATQSRRSADQTSWDVTGVDVTGLAAQISSVGYCTKLGRNEVGTQTSLSGESSIAADSSACPAVKVKVKRHGKRRKVRRQTTPLSGGWQFSDPAFLPSEHWLVPVGSIRTAVGWRTTAQHVGTATDQLTTYAYCGL